MKSYCGLYEKEHFEGFIRSFYTMCFVLTDFISFFTAATNDREVIFPCSNRSISHRGPNGLLVQKFMEITCLG